MNHRASGPLSVMSLGGSSTEVGCGAGAAVEVDGPGRAGAADPFDARCGAGDADATRWSRAFNAIALQRDLSTLAT